MNLLARRPCILAFGLLMNALALRGDNQNVEDRFVRESFVNGGFGLVIQPSAQEWMRLEESADLVTWRPSASVLSSNVSGAVLYIDDTVTDQIRFYRTARPDRSRDDASIRWRQWRNQHGFVYQFDIVRLSSSKGVLSARVKVDGEEKAVGNVVDLVTGEPVMDFDPRDFPSVDELFLALGNSEANPGRLVWVRYDVTRGFPIQCFFTDNPGSPGESVRYEIANVIATPSE
jgi:hypothetical protein